MYCIVSLRKELGLLELVVIGIAGAVGTGVLFSSAGMASDAGPGVVLGWILGSIFYFFIGLTYVEFYLYPFQKQEVLQDTQFIATVK